VGATVSTRMDGINYYGIETLQHQHGSNDDIVNVQGTAPAAPVSPRAAC